MFLQGKQTIFPVLPLSAGMNKRSIWRIVNIAKYIFATSKLLGTIAAVASLNLIQILQQ